MHDGIRYSAKKQTQNKGWTCKGIACYNKLFEMVTKDRRKHPKFMLRFKTAQQLAKGVNTKSMNRQI
jgi:hypothetical protein